jgi:hypothetical protein
VYNWTKEEKKIVDSILERQMNGELSYDEAAETAENYGILGWCYKNYSFNEIVRSYNKDFTKYIGKVKKEYINDNFELTEEEKRLLKENPDNISLMKGILDNFQRKHDNYEINQAKYYYRVAKDMMEHNYDDKAIKEILPLTDEAIKEIRGSILAEEKGKEEVAINFLKLGVNEEIVAKGTGLPIEKIIKLKKKYKN